jgi:SEC-C motif-containing protein
VADDDPCPCGRPFTFARCCRRLHTGAADALTAEDLMRSRFSAFAVGDATYLERSWHPATRPASVRLLPDQRWTRLEILATQAGGPMDQYGIVEFVAHRERAGRPGRLEERSRFTRLDSRWVYVGAEP